jgi:hypothetical protein
MSRRDAGTIFSQAQAITALSQVSSFWIDFFDPSHQIAQAYKTPKLHVRVNQTFTGNLTVLSVFLQDAPQAAGSVGPNAVPGVFENTLISFINIPKAALFAGNDIIMVDVPHTGGIVGALQTPFQPDTLSDSPLQRYIQFLYTCDQIPGTGSLDAWLDVL